MASESIGSVAPVARRVRAYFAPVDRAAGVATIFDASGIAGFNAESPPAPWVDLGWCLGFQRKCGTKIAALVTGAPGFAAGQVRTDVDATVTLEFESWGKVQMALTAGSQQMNVLRAQVGAAANGSGGTAVAAVGLNPGSVNTTASSLDVGSGSAGFVVGDVVAVDLDYAGQVGFIGSGVSGGYVKSAAAIGSDLDYVRRVTLNVARVTGIVGNVLTLGSALIAGVPTGEMKVSRVAGFCDREGSRYFQEWSGLFLVDGVQGGPGGVSLPAAADVYGCGGKERGFGGSAGGVARKGAAGGELSGASGEGRERRGDGGVFPELSAGGDADSLRALRAVLGFALPSRWLGSEFVCDQWGSRRDEVQVTK
jgi:hypothetical protein